MKAKSKYEDDDLHGTVQGAFGSNVSDIVKMRKQAASNISDGQTDPP